MTFQEQVAEIQLKLETCDKNKKELISTHLGQLFQWELDFLYFINAIKKEDDEIVIRREYPMLEIIKSNGEKFVKDLDGDIDLINSQIKELQATSTKGKLIYLPRNYPAYKEAKQNIEKQQAKDEYIAEKQLEQMQ